MRQASSLCSPELSHKYNLRFVTVHTIVGIQILVFFQINKLVAMGGGQKSAF